MQQPNLFRLLKIDDYSATPKYHQIFNGIVAGIETLPLDTGYLLPSINDVSYELDVSRVTVEKAYRKLKNMGFIGSVPGKGYYIAKNEHKHTAKILLVFNKLSPHKKIIYDEFVSTIGNKASVDLFVYNNEFSLFKRILDFQNKGFTHYVIIPHFIGGEEQAADIINRLTDGQVILIDKCIAGISISYKAVFEQFEQDIFNALTQALPRLASYKRLNLIFPFHSYYPWEIIFGFKKFCAEYAFPYRVVDQMKYCTLEKGDVYINLMEDDLIEVLEMVKECNMLAGSDIGLISYNETPWKKYILNGITTFSTDFAAMGQLAAKMVLEPCEDRVAVPFQLTLRPSL